MKSENNDLSKILESNRLNVLGPIENLHVDQSATMQFPFNH